MDCNVATYWKDIAQSVALLAAAGFFFWRLVSGYLVTNLSIGPRLSRTPKSETHDHLVVDVVLTKGDRESALLRKFNIKVSSVEHPLGSTKPIDRIFGDAQTPGRIAPGELTQFAEAFIIPRDSVCHVSVSIEGQSGFLPSWLWFTAYWSASVISVPGDRDERTGN